MASSFLRAFRTTCALGFAASVAFAACGGQEDVELGPGAAGPDGGGSSGADALFGDGSSRACNVDAGGHACLAQGATCSTGIECCSGRCDQRVCLEAGTCAGPGTPCSSRAACCSGRCEPVGEVRRCLNYCAPDGAACTSALECCSMACHGGVCGGAFCIGEDEGSCTTNADCCSGKCAPAPDGGGLRCHTASPCRATGEACSSACCSGVCTTGEDPRCDFGAGQCRPTGSICTTSAECCRGTCELDSNGVSVCSAPCLSDGAACSSGADCCGKICSGSPQRCGGAAAQCKLIGDACGNDGDCCSGQCIGGVCGNTCAPR